MDRRLGTKLLSYELSVQWYLLSDVQEKTGDVVLRRGNTFLIASCLPWNLM